MIFEECFKNVFVNTKVNAVQNNNGKIKLCKYPHRLGTTWRGNSES